MKPHMTEAELALLEPYIPKGGRVLEFGAGGSTLLFFERGVAHLTSVESDANWIGDIARQEGMLARIKERRWMPIHVDIGPVCDWGKPVSETPEVSWLRYHQQCWDMMPDTAFDLVFIDGRFRVACLCQSLLRCARKDVVFVMHDFWDREEYHTVLKLCKVVGKADTAVALKRKAKTDWRRLSLTLQAYQFQSL